MKPGGVARLALAFVVASAVAVGVAGASGAAAGTDLKWVARSCADAHKYTLFRADPFSGLPSVQLFPDIQRRLWFLLDPSPDGRWLAYDSQAGLTIATVDGRLSRILVGRSALSVSWSPDGTMLAFVVSQNPARELWLVNRDGGGLRKLNGDGDLPSWSPDSRSIGFVAQATSGRLRLSILRIDEKRTLAVAPTGYAKPQWSPRGDWIAYTGPDLSHVHLIRPDGSGHRVVGFGNAPSWAPDGTRLVFNRVYNDPLPPAAKAFGIVDLRGRLIRSIESGEAAQPTWSPKGDQITYARPVGSNGRTQVFLIRPDGAGRRQLTHDRPVAADDAVGGIVWVQSGPQKGRRLFYYRALCDNTP